MLGKLSKSVQPTVRSALHEIYLVETHNIILHQFREKFMKAMENLEKDWYELPAFYDFPTVHCTHSRTTNQIESTFATNH